MTAKDAPTETPDLLRRFHEQVRLTEREYVPTHVVEYDGPVRRVYPPDPAEDGAMIDSPAGLGPDPAAVIERQVAFFTARGQRVEWKTYSYDEPADLPELLRAYGFVPEDEEALMLGPAERVARPVTIADRYAVRAISADPASAQAEWEQVEALDEAVFGQGGAAWSRVLRAEEEADRQHVRSVVAVDREEGVIVGHGVLRLVAGTDFAGLWGGKVHPEHRGQGLYRAMAAVRAQWALDAGHSICRVDALPTSRPILIRMGLSQVATTTPYVLAPPRE
ncbi:GNAT family N-acetyltransferase [Nostocoides sp. F2B08]|uniref:GNAT family N-acetyltransferase n=1 Tax=Nostocoides sp. F2B08 TaxID=2653936 RepID=UPI00126398FD|nr:GNAT family N-acetyltransferase [Tetrasphaera sp. F2B08]KAB7745163.1 GNAT family N-acetyltransferase [Tetrasphaera sp. F2B08]